MDEDVRYVHELPDPRVYPNDTITLYEIVGLPPVVNASPVPMAIDARRVTLHRRASGWFVPAGRDQTGQPLHREFWIYGWSDEPGEVKPPPYRGRV